MNLRKLFFSFILLIFSALPVNAGTQKIILCSTYPIFQITRNVVKGYEGVTVELMIPAGLGCPHDYALTPQDMQKIAKADVLIVNGLGMEEYLGTPVDKANPHIKVIDSSDGIKDILYYSENEKEMHEEDGAHLGHEHSGTNPHLFASPRMVSLLAANIADGLAKIDTAGAANYLANAKSYAAKMNRLADEFSTLGKKLKNNRITTQHGVFDYFARDMGLEIVAVVQEHPGQEPSAAEMLSIVNTIKTKKAGAVFTEPQYPAKVGQTIAKEAGIATATLDPVATGPDNASLEYYEKVMRQNLLTLEKILGTK